MRLCSSKRQSGQGSVSAGFGEAEAVEQFAGWRAADPEDGGSGRNAGAERCDFGNELPAYGRDALPCQGNFVFGNRCLSESRSMAGAGPLRFEGNLEAEAWVARMQEARLRTYLDAS